MTKKLMTTGEAFLESLTPAEREQYELEFMAYVVSELKHAIKQEDKQSIKNLARMLIQSANKIKGAVIEPPQYFE